MKKILLNAFLIIIAVSFGFFWGQHKANKQCEIKVDEVIQQVGDDLLDACETKIDEILNQF